jgi:hypothetical protein
VSIFRSGRSLESEDRIEAVPDFVERVGDRCVSPAACNAADGRLQCRTLDNHLLVLRPILLELEIRTAAIQ